MWRKPHLATLPKNKKPSLAQLAGYPDMTGWFDPALLGKLLLRVVISDVFGQYADRRLIEAALDTKPKEELQNRDDLTGILVPDASGAIWIDYVADLGDGFDATYAVAYLLAQKSLTIDGVSLPRGDALFMGGDEVYPTASRDEYNAKLRAPYQFAFPNQNAPHHPRVFAIPGNHDWYDGLVNFLAFFCRTKPTRIGNWRTQQKRSYFATKLNDLCWIWAIDIALVADMDQPQADYFSAVAEAMPQNANIILCSAEPGWYKSDSDSYRSLSYAAWIAENAGKSLKIPLVLSGDTHHYSRYTSDSGTQYVTSGGGGAFLHGTHQLPKTIHADWLRHPNEELKLQHCHPSTEVSRGLLVGNLRFPFLNWKFALLLGAIYSVFGFVLSAVPRADLALIFFAVFAVGFVSYSAYQEKGSPKIVSLSLVHAIFQFAALLVLTRLWVWLDARIFSLQDGPWWAWLIEFVILMVPIGGGIAGLIFGLNLLLTCKFADMNHNDAFSAMRLDSFRHFLRIKVVGDQITVYPVGFDQTPRRDEWTDNPNTKQDPSASYFLPPKNFTPQFIEAAIVISGHTVAPTTDVKNPTELPRV